MKINRKNIMASFTDYDERTRDMMDNIVKQIIEQQKNPNDYALVVLQMLAVQFEIYFKALDSLGTDIVDKFELHGAEMSRPKPELDMLQKANNQISKLLKDLGLSPLEDAKIRKLKEKSTGEQSGAELLSQLIND